jgi:hypothetical protein
MSEICHTAQKYFIPGRPKRTTEGLRRTDDAQEPLTNLDLRADP